MLIHLSLPPRGRIRLSSRGVHGGQLAHLSAASWLHN